MIEVNAMGKVCPIPVIMTKKVLRENTAGENILILSYLHTFWTAPYTLTALSQLTFAKARLKTFFGT